jgi:hypothetical protein
LEPMKGDTESSCRRCPVHSSCRSADEAGAAEGLSARRVAGLSAACFLLPIAAAIIAAVAVRGEAARIVAGWSAFAATLLLLAGAGRMLRRRNAGRAGRGVSS